MDNTRLIAAALVTLLALVAAASLSGYLALIFLGLDTGLLKFATRYDYLSKATR